MLLPALSKAREKARSISCVNKLKTIGLAMAIYADDNDGFLTFGGNYANAYDYKQNGPSAASGTLAEKLYHTGYFDGGTVPYSLATDPDLVKWGAALKPFFHCPSDAQNFKKTGNYIYTSYWVNIQSAFNPAATNDPPKIGKYEAGRMGRDNPARVYVFDQYPLKTVDGSGYYDNHDNSHNALALGGHVITKKSIHTSSELYNDFYALTHKFWSGY